MANHFSPTTTSASSSLENTPDHDDLRSISSHSSQKDQSESDDNLPDTPALPLRDSVSPLGPLGSEPLPGVDSGWTAMAKIVHDIDERKIKDYKEDIDTILVFAGLFSAVMTAFLVESYQNLQQNPQDVMVTLLQQLVLQTQSYSLTSGYLNSTATPGAPSLPAFQPSINAIRVNVLWFASLVLSLISASFGILVKQWLREYLAGERTSPQARLRIRHFRHPGLSDWKVFEIAALLPMLLQLALALFFVDLCFFTADVHTSIRNTTLPLVAGWAFLFFAASLAPALSPRCPYKTTLLKTLNRWMREQLFNTISGVRQMMNVSWEAGALFVESKWSYRLLAYDEEDVAEDQNHDMDILVSVDAIQADERLVAVMWDALQQARVDAADAVTFLFKIITHRLGLAHTVKPSDSAFFDLRRLSKSTFTSLIEMAADLILRELHERYVTGIPKDIFEQSPWIKDCLYLLFSEGYSDSVLTPRVNAVLVEFIATEQRQVICNLIESRTERAPAFWLMRRLRTNLVRLRGDRPLDLVRGLLQISLCRHHDQATTHSTVLDILQYHHAEIAPDDLRDTVDVLVSCFANQGWEDGPGGQLSVWHRVYVECAIEYYASPVVNKVNIMNLVRMIILSPDDFHYYRYPAGLESLVNPHFEEASYPLLIDTFLASKPEDRVNILESLKERFAYSWLRMSESGRRELSTGVCVDPLKVCYVQLRFFKAMQERDEVPGEYLVTYLPYFWGMIFHGMRLVAGRRYAGHDQLAEKCLALIETLEPCPVVGAAEGDDSQAFAEWARSFVRKDSPFPDKLIKILLEFLPPGVELAFSARARRIRLLEQQSDVRLLLSVPSMSSRPASRRRRRSRGKKGTRAGDTQNSRETSDEDEDERQGSYPDAEPLHSREGSGHDSTSL